MTLDPSLLKQLIESFSSEFDEHAQAITNSLLVLEKNNLPENDKNKMIEIIFRSAHNIKGTSRSLGINDVSEIAHRIESFFSDIQKNNKFITPDLIDLCLDAVDKMHNALHAFIEHKTLPFDLNQFIDNFEYGKLEKTVPKTATPIPLTHSHSSTTDLESVRVPIQKIDKLSSLLEDVQVNKIAMEGHYSSLTQWTASFNEFIRLWKQLTHLTQHNIQFQTANECLFDIDKITKSMQKNIKSRLNELSQLSHTLQEEVRDLRMIPVDNILCTFPRYIRDLSHELNKQVELNTSGNEVKIDKAVLEQLKDPIIHILRNAIDHGIESTADRQAKGKSEIGKITIDIKEENGKMIISISDDGAGIPIDKIKKLILDKNYTSDQNLQKFSENEILDFIFQPGFSSKEIITDVSGRGIGLDVVKSNIEKLNGEVTVSTIPDKGTTFTLSVPLTISSARGLLVRSGKQLFVIPTAHLLCVQNVKIADMIHIQGGLAIQLNSMTIPVRMLADILDLPDKSLFSNQQQTPLVVVKKGHQTIAFIVDDIVGEKEIVLKSLRPPLDTIPFVAGGTLLENSQVVMVLEVDTLISASLQKNKMMPISSQESVQTEAEKPHILVVDDSITTRTLEKNVLESKNYQVTVAVNGQEAWEFLQKKQFSLLITDVMMPIMDGFTLTDKVKKSDKFTHLPVIIVTSLGSEEEKKRGIEVGADAYIIKSDFESETLLNIVSQLI